MYGVKICTDFSSVLSQCTRVTDGQTDRQTEFSSLDRVCIPCSAVKMEGFCIYICSFSIPFNAISISHTCL